MRRKNQASQKAVIDTRGTVAGVEVLKGPSMGLDQAAVYYTLTVNFRLE